MPVKTRSLLFLSVVLIGSNGLYFVYWFYKVNQEAAHLANDKRARPGRSVLAITLGAALVIPAFVALWRTTERVGYATKSYPSFPAQVLFSLTPLVILYPFWLQRKLNRHIGAWERRQRQIALSQSVRTRVVGVQAEIFTGPSS